MSLPPPTEKQARILWFSLTTLAVAISLGVLALLVWGIGRLLNELSAILMPIFFALILAYILDPAVEFFVRRRLSRKWSVLLVLLLGLLAVGGLVGSVIPDIISETRKLLEDLPHDTQVLRGKFDNFMQHSRLGHDLASYWHLPEPKTAGTNAPAAGGTNTNGMELTVTIKTNPGSTNSGQTNVAEFNAGTDELKKALASPFSETVVPGLAKVTVSALKWVTTQLGNVTTWLEFLIGFVLVPVYLFYFLFDKKGITQSWPDYLPVKESKAKEEIVFIIRALNDSMIVFFRGQVLVALCAGALLAIAYLCLGLNYALLLGVAAAVLEIVPYLGTIVGLVLALTVSAIQFGDWMHPLIVLGIAAVVKLLEDLVISPRIMGQRAGMHPLTVILAVLIGANLLGGFFGALVAIPFTAVLRTLMFRYIWKKRPSHARAQEAAPP